MRHRHAVPLILLAAGLALPQQLVHEGKIWDAAPHNAFTDLALFQGRFYCVFREGAGHVSPDGAIRVLVSVDARQWSSAALLRSEAGDLRDPHLSVTPSGELMLVAAAALKPGAGARHQTYAWFSRDGQRWSEPLAIGEPDYWLWRVMWHQGKAYGVGYPTNPAGGAARLYESEDGRRFRVLVSELPVDSSPNESSIAFLRDRTMLILLRREAGSKTAVLLSAAPPYQKWKVADLGVRLGGPHLLLLPDGRLVAAGRLYDGAARTGLLWLDARAGTLNEFQTLRSGGDTSYPGLVWHGGLLHVTYYSSHEGKTSIYGSSVKLP